MDTTKGLEQVGFGDLLRQLRKQRRLSQTALAAASGINQRYLSDLERGERTNPSRDVIQCLADALQVPITQLAEAAWSNVPTVDPAALAPTGVPADVLAELNHIWPELTAEDQQTALHVVRALWTSRRLGAAGVIPPRLDEARSSSNTDERAAR